MNRPTGTARIAVLDIGKTNLKLLVACEDGWPLETHSLPNAANTSGPYLAYDLAGLEEWFLDTLAIVSRRHAIGAVIATAHGCGAVLVDEDKPVLPMMDTTRRFLHPRSTRLMPVLRPLIARCFVASTPAQHIRSRPARSWISSAYPAATPVLFMRWAGDHCIRATAGERREVCDLGLYRRLHSGCRRIV